MTATHRLRVGTRSSPMARAQAEHVAAVLRGFGADPELVTFTTSGDRWHGSLTALGGKGAFVRELDRALLDGQIDLAVHCLKDIPGDELLPEGLALAAYLPRDDVHDALVGRAEPTEPAEPPEPSGSPGSPKPSGSAYSAEPSGSAESAMAVVLSAPGQPGQLGQVGQPRARQALTGLDDVPAGAVVGTSSVRRRAQLARHRPDLDVRPVRGNANTRLAKLDAGDYDVLVLALAGLQRIGVAHRATAVLPTDQMMPAIGAGILTVATRFDDVDTRALLARLDHSPTARAAAAERALLHALAGHCHSPIAGLASVEPDGGLRLRAAVYSLDGSTCLAASHWTAAGSPADLGRIVAEMLLAKGARELIEAARP